VSRYPPCAGCGAPVKSRDRDRCHICHQRAARAALKRPCPACGRVRHLRGDGLCAVCTTTGPAPAKTITCCQCGQQGRDAGHQVCRRCWLADPDWPFRYGASLAGRLPAIPPWWQALVEFAAARFHPGGAVTILRHAGRVISASPSAGPRQILAAATRPDQTPTPQGRALTAFFASQKLIMPGDQARQRAAARRQCYLDAVPAGLAAAVAAFNDTQLAERDRARRAGLRPLSDITLEARLRILRDLARHLTTAGPVTSWAEVTTADLDGFLATRPRSRRQDTYLLHRYFAWARQCKLLLIDPARPLQPGPPPAFTGTVLDTGTQRALLRRWTSPATHPHERLAGLLALLHAASSAQIRALTITSIDTRHRTLALAGRPFPTPADPATWTAVQACLAHRDQLATINPHVIVTHTTRTSDAPADSSYLSGRLTPAGTTPSACRQTRIAQLVNDLDPKLTAAALGMHNTGLVRYLADNVTHDRLHRTNPPDRPGHLRQHLAHLPANLCGSENETVTSV
jgi:hypothetical protein